MPPLHAPRSPVLAVMLIGSAIALVGCSAAFPPDKIAAPLSPPTPPSPAAAVLANQSRDLSDTAVSGELNGIRYELRGANSVTVNMVNQAIRLQAGADELVIDQQRLYLNGRDRGAISAPATLLLDAQGRLFVNGELRSSTD